MNNRSQAAIQGAVPMGEYLRQRALRAFTFSLLIAVLLQACSTGLTPEQKQRVAELTQQLAQIRQDIGSAKQDSAQYSGGLIKELIAIRLEILQTNAALVEQRINALEAGSKVTVVTQASKPDPARAAELAKEIATQTTKLGEAKVEASRYEGGLVKAMADTTVATVRNNLAMLEQQYLIAQYGLAIPAFGSAASIAEQTKTQATTDAANKSVEISPDSRPRKDCLKIDAYDSSVLSSNDVFVELAWKALRCASAGTRHLQDLRQG
jgi:hypothetical protein